MCLSCMPLEELKQAAGPEQDALACQLLQWFKHRFFTWASQGSASSCSSCTELAHQLLFVSGDTL